MFPTKIQALIDQARERMAMTHDADQKTIRVSGMSHGAWMIFSYDPAISGMAPVAVVESADNVKYDTIITGKDVAPWWEVNAAWDAARIAVVTLHNLIPAVHTLHSGRITVKIAAYLAMKDRIDRWGGFTGERDSLPVMFKNLTPQERCIVADRLEGKVI
jgi:hypothetical protein